MINCKQWQDIGEEDKGVCLIGLKGGVPSKGICNRCDQRVPRDKGLGDLIESTLVKLKVQDQLKKIVARITGHKCGCNERKNLLNKIVPFK